MGSYYYRRKNNSVDSSSKSTKSADSDGSSRTISSPPNSIPSLERRDSNTSPAESELFEYQSRASADTYCTTVASFDEYEEDERVYDYYNYRHKTHRPSATPATPTEFAALFPTTNQIKIGHDESSSDGDMNIRVDRVVRDRYGQDRTLTLFHLRMYDLEKREFSLRRYGRDCGREVAHTHAKVEKPSLPKRPTLQRSVSKAFSSFKGKNDHEKHISLQRQDSGYGSAEDDDDTLQNKPQTPEEPKSTNAVVLEFSNYAHVQLTRKGNKMSRKYDFEYWGKNYSWKRYVNKSPVTGEQEVSFQLFNNASPHAVAIIKPDNPTFPNAESETGEFVPPCSFYMKDTPTDPIKGPADVADTIMATGLMALVDDCIKRKFSKKKIVQLAIPLPMRTPLKMNMEYVGPKRLIDEVFNRARPGIQARSLSSPVGSPMNSPSRRR